MQRLAPALFLRPTLSVARALLGSMLWTRMDGQFTAGMIVEVEAYLGGQDPAAHSYRGQTERTRAMFEIGGTCYVYFIYGMHFCVNVSTGPRGVGEAVLIRAIEPLEGLEVMQDRRKVPRMRDLSNGPGKLCQALGIDSRVYGEHFSTSQKIGLAPGRKFRSSAIATGPRIGIRQAADRPWRFFVRNNPFVSKG